MTESEHYVECVDTMDLEGQLDYWKRKYQSLVCRQIPPWNDCINALHQIERLEQMIGKKSD